jgi:hypothetical protein
MLTFSWEKPQANALLAAATFDRILKKTGSLIVSCVEQRAKQEREKRYNKEWMIDDKDGIANQARAL